MKMYLSGFSCGVFQVSGRMSGCSAYPQNVHILYCHIKSVFLLTFYVFGSHFLTLAEFLKIHYVLGFMPTPRSFGVSNSF